MSQVKPIITAAVIHILVLGTLILVLFLQSNQTALQYARLAELSANSHAAALVLEHRNDVQKQFSVEREDMKQYVNDTVSRRITQLKMGRK